MRQIAMFSDAPGSIVFADILSGYVLSGPEKNDTVYYDKIRPKELESYIGLENISVAVKGNEKANPTYRAKSGVWYKPLKSRWGFTLSTAQGMFELEEEARSLGYDVDSAGSLARQLIEEAVKNTVGYCEGLPVSFHRHFSDLFQGPMVMLQKGYVPYAEYIDQNQAYLNAFTKPLGVTFADYPSRAEFEPTAEECLTGRWSVEALFSTKYRHLPLVQKRTNLGNLWVYGSAWSKMAGLHLRLMLESGDLDRKPVFSEAYEVTASEPCGTLLYMFDKLQKMSKPLRKKVYTKLVGSLAHHTSYRYSGKVKDLLAMSESGLLSEKGQTEADKICFFESSELPYITDDIRTYNKIPPSFRPDIAWFIWEYCTAQTLYSAMQYDERLLCSHIDSLIVRGEAKNHEGWSLKAKGAYDGYGIGNYTVGEHVSSSGYEDDSAVSIEEHFSSVYSTPDNYRDWKFETAETFRLNPAGRGNSYVRDEKGTVVFGKQGDTSTPKNWKDTENMRLGFRDRFFADLKRSTK